MSRALMIVITLLFMNAVAFPQEVKVSSSPDTTAILIGDQTGFTVSAEIPAGTVVDLSTVSDTLAGKIVVLQRNPRDTSKLTDGRMVITDKYLVTAFDSGTYVIPPFYAEVAAGDSLERFYSDYSSLKVLRPDITPQDTTDVIFDIIPPRTAPVTFNEILPWIIIALIAAAVIYLLARFLPRNPLRRLIRPQAPPEPADIIAMRELSELKEKELWQHGEIKEYYSILTDIIRRYLDNRYNISSPELTTDETVRMLQKARVTTHEQMALVREMLSLSDLVKFAKYVPTDDLHEKCYDDAVSFVNETKVPEVTAEDNKEKGGENA